MKWTRRIAIAVVALFVGSQFVPLDRSNPPVTGEIEASADVMAILKKACYDCHSNEVNWPWYAWVSPVSFAVTHHVEEGREHLNFSEWDKLSADDRAEAIEECWEEVEEGEMPMFVYLPMHSEAKLTEEEHATLKAWASRYGKHDDD
ncbi:MAG: heme-binding domain-containing protein [bacterium]|nr:heme-binding domain-containing protein [bacterium]